jgi:hypothetical protein
MLLRNVSGLGEWLTRIKPQLTARGAAPQTPDNDSQI